MNELYRRLRTLVSNDFKIQISDGKNPNVVIKPDSESNHPWTHFDGDTTEDSLMRAIVRLGLRQMDIAKTFTGAEL